MGKDVYFMEVLDDLLVVNDNYQGILIFNSELRQINQIKLIEDMNIYTSFKKDKELLLFCPDNDCLIYVDLYSNKKIVIPLVAFDEWIFSPIYEWNKKKVILSDYWGNFLKVDLDIGALVKAKACDEGYQEICENYNKLNRFKVFKTYILKKEAFVETPGSKIGIVNYKQDLKVLNIIEKEQYHDFELANDYIAKIGERKVECIFKSKQEIYYPSEHYSFLRGKFMFKDEKVYLFLLSGNKADSSHTKIEKYKF